MTDKMHGTTPAGAARKTFNDDVIERSVQFANDTLALIPELEGIAIIPSYTVPQEHLPHGVIVGRHGPLRTPSELMHMAMQLHGVLRQQLDQALGCLAYINREMGAMQERLTGLREQTSAAEQRLAELNAGAATHQQLNAIADVGSPGS